MNATPSPTSLQLIDFQQPSGPISAPKPIAVRPSQAPLTLRVETAFSSFMESPSRPMKQRNQTSVLGKREPTSILTSQKQKAHRTESPLQVPEFIKDPFAPPFPSLTPSPRFTTPSVSPSLRTRPSSSASNFTPSVSPSHWTRPPSSVSSFTPPASPSQWARPPSSASSFTPSVSPRQLTRPTPPTPSTFIPIQEEKKDDDEAQSPTANPQMEIDSPKDRS